MTRTDDAITRSEPTRQGAAIEAVFGTIPQGQVVTTEYLLTLAIHGREFFESISSPVAAFFAELVVRLRSGSLYRLPHNFTRADLDSLLADVRRAVESGAADDGGTWVGVVGRKGLVRRGVARARDWKIRGKG